MPKPWSIMAWVVGALVLAMCGAAMGQEATGPPMSPHESVMRSPAWNDLLPTRVDQGVNPLRVVEAAADALTRRDADAATTQSGGLSAGLNIMLLLTVITLVPSIMLMTTCFVRIVIVLALLRQALGTQSLPPPQVSLGLALFMTLLVMTPTIDRIYAEAVGPYQRGEIRDVEELWLKARQPVRDFMFDQIERTGNWSSVYMMLNYRGVDTSRPENLTRADVDMISLIPAYMLSELKTAFLMGFRIYLPFLVIDMVIASLLISMSMMMLPPVLISLPFKLLLFVLVDGWQLVVGGLMQSFVQDTRGVETAMLDGSAPALAAATAVLMLPGLIQRSGFGRAPLDDSTPREVNHGR